MSSGNNSVDESDEYQDEPKARSQSSRVRKRRKVADRRPILVATAQPAISLDPLLYPAKGADETEFDEYMLELLPEYLRTRAVVQERDAVFDHKGRKIRPMTRSEEAALISQLENDPSASHPVLFRKLKLNREKRMRNLRTEGPGPSPNAVTPLPSLPQNPPVKPEVLDGLYSIQTTPFENSFLSRVHSATVSDAGLIAVDWETKSPWMNLLNDIREHYSYAHSPEREQPVEVLAPIIYTALQPNQISQVHDLLERTFWSGINVTDSLDYSPERCTVVAVYKKLVVGVAVLSSPQEAYMTYLAVKAGWDNSHIARTMLYHIITLNPYKDITLHVSTNNPAVLLYNLFGFKAEEFVAGFYEDYLDHRSSASKNAFRLRLRQQH